MGKEEGCCTYDCGKMVVIAALLLAIGMVGASYLLSQGDYAPNVDVGNITSMPNVYVSSQPPEHTLSVSASASDRVSPDLLLVQLRVQTEDRNAKEAQSENADVTADLRTKLEALGIQDSDIQTTSYSVEPVYESTQQCDASGYNCRWDSKLTGYRAVHQLTVRLTDLDKGGEVIDAAATAGTNQTFTDYVSFTLKDETRRNVERSLLQNASSEAGAKARSIASGLGTTLGKVTSASESYSYYPYDYRGGYAMEAASAAPTVLSPGEVEVSMSVSVQYEIS